MKRFQNWRVYTKNMKVSKVRGIVVNVGRLAGGNAEFNFDLHALRRINYRGVTFRTRSVSEIRDVYSRMWADLSDLVVTGKLSLPIDKIFKFNDVADALSCMRDNQHFGKLILKV